MSCMASRHHVVHVSNKLNFPLCQCLGMSPVLVVLLSGNIGNPEMIVDAVVVGRAEEGQSEYEQLRTG